MSQPMDPTSYAIAAYVAGLGLMWGYAAMVWWSSLVTARREAARRKQS